MSEVSKTILVSGASGFVGKALVDRLQADGHRVMRLVRDRRRSGGDEVYWLPEQGILDRHSLEGVDAVVHLAGEPVLGRWTVAKKRRIHQSRVAGTLLLAEALAALDQPPSVMVCASAIGFYGDRRDELLDESSESGEGFLAGVVRDWESASLAAERAGIRVVRLRIGLVLGKEGGPLAAMLRAFRLGLGGAVGNGRQYQSWITLRDLVGAILFALEDKQLRGAVNAVAPKPLRQREWADSLGRALKRPAFLPMPGLAVRALLGEAGQELLLASTRVRPKVLLDAGFQFEANDFGEALRQVLAE